MNKLLLILLILILYFPAMSQQESRHTHIFDNHFWQNPAASGVFPISVRLADYHKIRLNYLRELMHSNPVSQKITLSYNRSLKSFCDLNLHAGFGARLQFYRNNSFEKFNVDLAGSYHFYSSGFGRYNRYNYFRKLMISVGHNIKFASFKLFDTSNTTVLNGQNRAQAFDADLGIYLKAANIFAGISIVNLIEWPLRYNVSQPATQTQNLRQFQAMIGFRINIGKFNVLPSAYFRMIPGANPQVDINIKLGFFRDRFFAGINYRTNMDLAFFLAFNIRKYRELNRNRRIIHLVYSYEFSASPFQQYESILHEITIGVDLEGKFIMRHVSPDF
jgi:type IX secretion system PorP/SprF family membrane protein